MKLYLALFVSILMLSSPTHAQSRGNQNIGGILEDIFGGNRAPTENLVDSIPVEVQFNAPQRGLPDEAMLIVSAFAPAQPNVRRRAPLMIGETRLLLTSLNAPLNLSIAAPESVTRDIDYARLEAKIVGFDGNVLFEMTDSAEYRGYQTPVLYLEPVDTQTVPAPNTAGFETVEGSVSLNGNTPTFRGSSLVVRLVEETLAGGSNPTITGEHRLDIDDKTGPFSFKIERAITPGREDIPLVYEAWIEDWAGRRTHTLNRPSTYNGPSVKPRLVLEPVAANTPQTSNDILKGEAQFDAYKGLPAGSVLIVELERFEGGNRPNKLSETRVNLDGLSGNVAFELDAPNGTFDDTVSSPILRARIEDKNGNLFFSNPGGTPWRNDSFAVSMGASPNY